MIPVCAVSQCVNIEKIIIPAGSTNRSCASNSAENETGKYVKRESYLTTHTLDRAPVQSTVDGVTEKDLSTRKDLVALPFSVITCEGNVVASTKIQNIDKFTTELREARCKTNSFVDGEPLRVNEYDNSNHLSYPQRLEDDETKNQNSALCDTYRTMKNNTLTRVSSHESNCVMQEAREAACDTMSKSLSGSGYEADEQPTCLEPSKNNLQNSESIDSNPMIQQVEESKVQLASVLDTATFDEGD
eukprot:CAMPEP_0171304064 /NCGR_PEP_ID=MMETSP0816-20121228/13728_1 /TAXON_ID=420281 /ORGANISM="Proboscia inermis, Strain CCAP1064/1" /LENGTH=244 /DNA_ID=CAMNT_0011783841 /DNA_START=318 /DNA_END=1052 /DNA_ORIENTATION=-